MTRALAGRVGVFHQRSGMGGTQCVLNRTHHASGQNAISEIVREKIKSEPLAQLDYVAVVDSETLEPVEKIASQTGSVISDVYRFNPEYLPRIS